MSSSEARRIHIEAWQTSGMTQAAYCREHGLNTKTFGNWVRKHRAARTDVRHVRQPDPHPLFRVVAGEIEPWEVITAQ